MKQPCLRASLVVWALFAAAVFAQETSVQSEVETLRRQMNDILRRQTALEEQNAQLIRDNQTLKTQVETVTATSRSEELEAAINALVDGTANLDGTVVKSVANPITFSGEARIRGGYTSNRNFGATPTGAVADGRDDDGTFVDARFNLAFDFAFDEDIATHFELISAGLYDNGQADHNAGNLDEVDLYQGWILFTNLFGRKEIGLRTGRQEIVLGNEFQFGNNDFFDGETFDSTLFWWDDPNFRVILVWAKLDATNSYNPANHPYTNFGAGGGHDDDEAYAVYATIRSIENHEIDLYYFFLNGNRGTSQGTLGNVLGAGFNVYAHVVGGRIGGKFPSVIDGLDYNVEAAYEFGELNGVAIDVDGFTVEATIGLTFCDDCKARVYGMVIYAEGAEGSDSGYVTLFPEAHAQTNWDDHTARRARWGLMDIIPMSNVLAGQIGFAFRPTNDWIVGIAAIYAVHDQDVTTIDATTDDGIGFELDLYADHRLSNQATVGIGLGFFVPDDGAPLQGAFFTGNDDDVAVLLYLQTRVVF